MLCSPPPPKIRMDGWTRLVVIPGVVFVPGQIWIVINSRCFFPSSAETCNVSQSEREREKERVERKTHDAKQT